MNMQLVWDNLVAYSMQIGLLVGLAAFVPTALRLRLPASRLAYWHVLLAACLLLPALRPWKQVAITLSTFVPAAIPAPVAPQPAPAPSLPLTDIALAVLVGGMLIRMGWLGLGLWRLARLRRHSLPLDPPSSWGVEADIRISEAISSPVTFGFLSPAILLPANFPELEASAQEAILCHEVLHVRRGDWLFTLAEELVRSIFWFHPAIWWLLGEIGLAREQVVDREVVKHTRSRDQYVDALLAIAGANHQLDLAPAPLFLRKRHLKQRVMSIMKEVRMSRTRSMSSLAAGLGVLALACWFVTATFPLAAAPQMVTDGPGVTVDTGGAVLHRGSVFYPEAARTKRVQGVVMVEATIDGSGNVLDTRVLSGPVELRQAAQLAVLRWHFATDSSSNMRQVRINFDLSALPEMPTPNHWFAPDRPPQMDLASRQAAEDKLKALRAQISQMDPQAQDPATRQLALAKLDELKSNLAAAQSRIGVPSPEGKRVLRIATVGLTDAMRNDLLSRLPVHEGDVLSADQMARVRRAAHDFDEHMMVGTIYSNEQISLTFSIPGTSASSVTPGGVVGGIIGSVPSVVPGSESKPAVPLRITIGGNVQQAKLVRQPKPAYPALAKQARISGVVHLAAVIGKEGGVIDLQVISGHPLLVPAAIEAVKLWVYQPTLLNGEPVEVSTQIDVNFTLTDDPPIQQPQNEPRQ